MSNRQARNTATNNHDRKGHWPPRRQLPLFNMIDLLPKTPAESARDLIERKTLCLRKPQLRRAQPTAPPETLH